MILTVRSFSVAKSFNRSEIGATYWKVEGEPTQPIATVLEGLSVAILYILVSTTVGTISV